MTAYSDKESITQTWQQLPEPRRSDPTYYDRPLLKEPVWEWAIPTYYYVGGLAGAALVLGAAVRLRHSKHLQRFMTRCNWIGFIGSCAGGALLIYDLGRPSRFLNMLRVFRPTSPMNIGAWTLSATGATSLATVLLERRRGVLGGIGEACGYISGVLGTALGTYTGVLVANTAIPVWQESRRVLPVLFSASAMASFGSALEIFAEAVEERRMTTVFACVGQLAEVTAGVVMERSASVVPRVARPLKHGLSGVMWKTAAVLTATSFAINMLPNRGRSKRIAAGVVGTLGSLIMRFAVHHAGVASARDARAGFHQQRAGHGAAEIAHAAVTSH
jgi:formate-dependent nitrite reductase membrane component NrfD